MELGYWQSPPGALGDDVVAGFVVPAQSANVGDVIFILPRDTSAAKLKIMQAGDSAEIPLSWYRSATDA